MKYSQEKIIEALTIIEVSQLAKEITIPEFSQKAEREIAKEEQK